MIAPATKLLKVVSLPSQGDATHILHHRLGQTETTEYLGKEKHKTKIHPMGMMKHSLSASILTFVNQKQ
ncbi:hypothetical protein T10_6324 [Trichinella papuae]|uniref:Uncharacterized protein n=1 Tax=Trichinella papuae TaxID=268474 RepID=A0A0V1MEK6_9BILA|nr:hypothetical protein T10_6324 [Trichinella papuae]